MNLKFLSIALFSLAWVATGQSHDKDAKPMAAATYVLGPGDQITIFALDAEEFAGKKVPIDASGFVSLPLVGRVKADGLTTQEFEAALNKQLKTYIQNPMVSVMVSEFRSQPVSIIGAVKNPGVHQLEGQKTLVEMLSLAGGLREDAGFTIKITRQAQWGPIPLSNATKSPNGDFYVASVNTRSILSASSPEDNIFILPRDVVSVPRADLVYVVGEVTKPGGFVLNDRESISVLQALSLAGGTKPEATKMARLLRSVPNSSQRVEIAVNLKGILAGKSEDLFLKPDDVLFIPSSSGKKVALRTTEVILSTISGVVIFRGAR